MENWVEKVAEEYVRHLTSMKEETGNIKFVDPATGKEDIITPKEAQALIARIGTTPPIQAELDLHNRFWDGKEDNPAKVIAYYQNRRKSRTSDRTELRGKEVEEGEEALEAAKTAEEQTKKTTTQRIQGRLAKSQPAKETTNEELNWVNTLRESYIKEIGFPCNNSENKNENE